MPLFSDFVSIPFRADTGFEHLTRGQDEQNNKQFQSLSGLTLGLNGAERNSSHRLYPPVSIPFRADTGFEQNSHLNL